MRTLRCVFVGHRWGEWERVSPVVCREFRICDLGCFEQRTAAHDWDVQLHPATCARTDVCQRCGARTDPLVAHHWGPWEADPVELRLKRHTCTLCDAVEADCDHAWVAPRQRSLTDELPPFECVICGEMKLESVDPEPVFHESLNR